MHQLYSNNYNYTKCRPHIKILCDIAESEKEECSICNFVYYDMYHSMYVKNKGHFNNENYTYNWEFTKSVQTFLYDMKKKYGCSIVCERDQTNFIEYHKNVKTSKPENFIEYYSNDKYEIDIIVDIKDF